MTEKLRVSRDRGTMAVLPEVLFRLLCGGGLVAAGLFLGWVGLNPDDVAAWFGSRYIVIQLIEWFGTTSMPGFLIVGGMLLALLPYRLFYVPVPIVVFALWTATAHVTWWQDLGYGEYGFYNGENIVYASGHSFVMDEGEVIARRFARIRRFGEQMLERVFLESRRFVAEELASGRPQRRIRQGVECVAEGRCEQLFEAEPYQSGP